MRIIHCADLHLDAKMTAHLSREQAKQRKDELLHTFGRMVNYAEERKVNAILIAGDMFDRNTISVQARKYVYDLITSHPYIVFFYLEGNHDAASFIVEGQATPENLKVFPMGWKTYVLYDDGERAITLSGAQDATLDADGLRLKQQDFNIVTLHGQIGEKDDEINLKDYCDKGIDYLALGHIHSYTEGVLLPDGVYCYPGCLEGRGFDECGPCGFVLIDTGTNNTDLRIRFVPFASRRLYRVTCDITGCVSDTEVFGRAEAALRSSGAGERDLVRLELTGSLEYGCSPDPGLMQKEWEDDFHYFEYRNCAEPVIHSEDFVCDATLKGEFVRTVNAADDLSEDERVRVLRCGLRALSGKSPF